MAEKNTDLKHHESRGRLIGTSVAALAIAAAGTLLVDFHDHPTGGLTQKARHDTNFHDHPTGGLTETARGDANLPNSFQGHGSEIITLVAPEAGKRTVSLTLAAKAGVTAAKGIVSLDVGDPVSHVGAISTSRDFELPSGTSVIVERIVAPDDAAWAIASDWRIFEDANNP